MGERLSESVQSGTGPLRDDVRANTSAFMCITVPQNTVEGPFFPGLFMYHLDHPTLHARRPGTYKR